MKQKTKTLDDIFNSLGSINKEESKAQIMQFLKEKLDEFENNKKLVHTSGKNYNPKMLIFWKNDWKKFRKELVG